MLSSDSEDDFEYSDYTLQKYNDLEGPPLIKKKSRLIAAVVQNQVEVLSDLLDSPRWYNVQDYGGYSLLQIAILQQSIEVFDYMLSIPDFPLEFVNSEGQTALGVAFELPAEYDISMRDHFAYELIRKGANIDQTCYGGNKPLHCAIQRPYINTTKLLIQKAVDVNLTNFWGISPLTFALLSCDDLTEVVTTLLAYGAEPSFHDFELSVENNASFEVQETLFLLIYDEYSNLTLDLDVVLKLAETESPLFYQVIKFPIEATIRGNYGFWHSYLHFRVLCSINTDCLVLIIQKFGHIIKKGLLMPITSHMNHSRCSKAVCLENLNIMLESDLKTAVITFISNLKSCRIFEDLWDSGYDKIATTQLYCYLLSYGLHIEELDLQMVYKKFGYCELFKILLYMDVQMGVPNDYTKYVMPVFRYDVNMTLDQFFQSHGNYCKNSVNELLHYFVHPKLNEICFHNSDGTDNYQEIPLLVELARNAFRNFFVKKFKIRSSKAFYTLLKSVPVSGTYKKIITYDTKLY